MLRPSFVPPPALRELRDLTWYRVDLIAARTAEKQRVEKLLEDALIMLSVVVSDVFVVVRAAHDGGVGRRGTRPEGVGRDGPQVDGITADIDIVQARVDEQIAPFAKAVTRLEEIPGIGVTAARAIIAEIGLDMSRFPTPARLASWARFAPGVSESAGRKKGNSGTGHGNRYLARALGEAAVGASRTRTFLGERYRRIAKRRGKKRAIVAVGRSTLTIIWELLGDEQKHFVDLGPD